MTDKIKDIIQRGECCEWNYEPESFDGLAWTTECGKDFIMPGGQVWPEKNMKFCAYCGKKINLTCAAVAGKFNHEEHEERR